MFLLYGKLRAIIFIETTLQTTLLSPHTKYFLKIERSKTCNLYPCPIFRIILEEKYSSCYILLIDQISLSHYLYFMRYRAICVLQLFVNLVVRLWILKFTLPYLPNQSIFLTWPVLTNVLTKLKHLEKEKSF